MEKQAKESKPGVKFTRFTYLFSPHQSALNKKWQLQPWQADPRSSATPPQVTAHYIPLLSSKAQQSFSSTPNSALQPPPFNAHFPFELLIPKQRKKIQAWMNPMLVSSLRSWFCYRCSYNKVWKHPFSRDYQTKHLTGFDHDISTSYYCCFIVDKAKSS
ncbi:Uncharacterized protein TCM_027260 isoform 2 [Theobroma cacao]|uniref:Uncharacterized protein isoform 2 n=1 Tax=Theobroma cacao TaxID=3641 RepID=A0A061G7P7_THECC|nr:Uncharacterized protein TCM_027260 isoform 2 [Theobroma cacao]